MRMGMVKHVGLYVLAKKLHGLLLLNAAAAAAAGTGDAYSCLFNWPCHRMAFQLQQALWRRQGL
jgi:hypothetical protein